ncbi:MAG TPA: flagellar type III secretion system pore protein FliP [Gemmatimonadales bacterium]|jgi:flagellar biosynthetic protein FliP
MFAAVAALLITIGVMLLALKVLGRMQGVTRGGTRGASLQLLDRVATGPRHGVVLLRAGDRVLVVGVGENHTLLGELTGTERDAALEPRQPAISGAAVGWRTALARFGLVTALVVMPHLARAQVITAPAPTRTHQAQRPAAVPAPTVQGPTAPTVNVSVGTPGDELKLTGAVGIVVLMGALTLLPAVFMLMTGFTRILIVLSFLRSALGTQSAPPSSLLVAIALILTSVVMHPVLETENHDALQPYLRGEIGQVEAYKAALLPLRKFMLANTRDRDLTAFADMSGAAPAATVDDIPTMTVVAAFVTGELRTAFQMGFVIFLPFLVIDLIVASVLMSMGMFMLPPVMVSLPFKLLLFVLADGWALVMQNLVASFRVAT